MEIILPRFISHRDSSFRCASLGMTAGTGESIIGRARARPMINYTTTIVIPSAARNLLLPLILCRNPFLLILHSAFCIHHSFHGATIGITSESGPRPAALMANLRTFQFKMLFFRKK